MVKVLDTVPNVKKNKFQIRPLEEITFFLFMMYSLINLKVLPILPKVFLACTLHAYMTGNIVRSTGVGKSV